MIPRFAAAVIVAAGVFTAAGCTYLGGSDPAPTTSTFITDEPTPLRSPSATASAPTSQTAPPAPSAEPTSTLTPARSPEAAATPASPSPDTTSSGPAPESIPGALEPADPSAAQFAQCSEEYLALTVDVLPSDGVSPSTIEDWATRYENASALAADGDYTAAVTACRALVAEVEAAYV